MGFVGRYFHRICVFFSNNWYRVSLRMREIPVYGIPSTWKEMSLEYGSDFRGVMILSKEGGPMESNEHVEKPRGKYGKIWENMGKYGKVTSYDPIISLIFYAFDHYQPSTMGLPQGHPRVSTFWLPCAHCTAFERETF